MGDEVKGDEVKGDRLLAIGWEDTPTCEVALRRKLRDDITGIERDPPSAEPEKVALVYATPEEDPESPYKS